MIGALAILLIRGDAEVIARNARATALWTAIATFIVSIFLWTGFDTSTADFQFVERIAWIPSLGIYYHLGVDGISVFFVLLSTFGKLASDRTSCQRIHDRIFNPRNVDDRDVLCA